jgi:hypothetical protein
MSEYRELANELALKVSRMSGGTLQGYPLEGAVSAIEKALEKAHDDALTEAMYVASIFNGSDVIKNLKRLRDEKYD